VVHVAAAGGTPPLLCPPPFGIPMLHSGARDLQRRALTPEGAAHPGPLSGGEGGDDVTPVPASATGG